MYAFFQLKAPIDGNCVDDQFYVAGQNLNNLIPTLCGVNSGQHSNLCSEFHSFFIFSYKLFVPTFVVYIEVSNSMDRKVFLTILTSSVAARAFNIRVQQVNLTIKITLFMLFTMENSHFS